MRQRRRSTGNMEEGQDSFLDVISNMVGILIILVMIAGVRAANNGPKEETPPDEVVTPSQSSEWAEGTTLQEIERLTHETMDKERAMSALQIETAETEAAWIGIDESLAVKSREHAAIVDRIASIKAALEIHREQFDTVEKERQQVQFQLALADTEREQLEGQRQRLEESRPQATTIENRPTPLAREVDGKEAQFRISHGRISFVPYLSLIEKMRLDVVSRRNDYAKQPVMTSVVGPIEGYRMRFTIISRDVLYAGQCDEESVGRRLELDYAEFIPSSDTLGESIERATEANSDLMKRLALYRPDIYTITFWVYPDSFEEYRTIRQSLYARGYKVAAWLLTPGQPISASPYGTKSSAQ